MADHPELIELLRATLGRFPEVRLAMLFGSRGRGAAREGSDVDLAVEAVRGRSLDRLRLIAELSAATGLEVDVVDVTPGRRLTYPLLAALVREGVAVYEGVPHAEACGRWRPGCRTRARGRSDPLPRLLAELRLEPLSS